MGKVRQKIVPLFDYCGDRSRNAGSGVKPMYSSEYSPHNIRRVVISPDGVMVVYHKSTAKTGGRTFGYVQFSAKDLYLEEQDPKYKPILRMLADPVCQCLEEIVVLSRASYGQQVHENYRNEVRLESMVASFKGAGYDLKGKISNRFTRLRYYTEMGVDFQYFLDCFVQFHKSREDSKYDFFSEMPWFKDYAQKTELAGPDYWRNWGINTGTYSFDVALREHFVNVKQKHEDAEKFAAVSAAREKRVGGKVQAINELIDDYLVYSKLWVAFNSIVQKEGTNGVLPDLSFVRPVETVQLLPFKGMAKVPEQFISKQPCSEAEAFEKDEAMLKNYKAKCCRALAVNFLTALSKLQGEPYLLKTLVKDCETTVCVPQEMKQTALAIQESTGVVFSGKDFQASIVNCCWQFMQYFVGCAHTEPFTRRYWESKIQRRAAKA